jgi:PEGA domain-containing protein
MRHYSGLGKRTTLWLLCAFFLVPHIVFAQTNEVLGEVELMGATKVEKTSGVWVDGQYLGYLDELKGTKKILLLPGKHEIIVRQGGYKDVPIAVAVQPGQKQVFRVVMEKDTRLSVPTVTAEIKLMVNPDRAAVFVDDLFIGHVAEFRGVGKALLVAPGKRKIRISLPGYQSFATEVNLVANQKFEIKTDLIRSGSIEPDSQPDQR